MKKFIILIPFFGMLGCSLEIDHEEAFNEVLPTVAPTKKDDSTVCAYWKCSGTKKLYMQKYVKQPNKTYKPAGAFKLDNGIGAFPLADLDKYVRQSEAASLTDIDPCPYCSNHRVGISSCGKVLCLPPPPPVSIPQFDFCLTIDHSGSMQIAGKRQAVKQAAKIFVSKRDLTKDRIAIVVFSTQAKIYLDLSQDNDKILQTIDDYNFPGNTDFSEALKETVKIFSNNVSGNRQNVTQNRVRNNAFNRNPQRNIDNQLSQTKDEARQKVVLFFTDGENLGDKNETMSLSSSLRQNEVTLIAVATDDADKNYLNEMTADPKKVIIANGSDIGSAFEKAEEVIESTTINAASSEGKGTHAVCPWCGKDEIYRETSSGPGASGG